MPRAERVARLFSAFANGEGGTLWLGVRADGAAMGVEDVEAAVEELDRVARDLVVPRVEVSVERHMASGVQLVSAVVMASEEKPVLAPARDGRLRAFVREGSSTRRAPLAVARAWERAAREAPLDEKWKRVLRAMAQADGERGTTVDEIARAARAGVRATRRALGELQRRGLANQRGDGRHGVTPRGRRWVRRR